MKIEIHPQFGPLNSKPIFDAFIKSLQDAGETLYINQSTDNADVAVIWSVLWQGRMKNYKKIWDEYTTKNKPVVVLEVGGLRRNKSFKVGINGVNNKADFANQYVDDKRWSLFNHKFKPWRTTGNKIIVLGQHHASEQWKKICLIPFLRRLLSISNNFFLDLPCKINLEPNKDISWASLEPIKPEAPKIIPLLFFKFNIDYFASISNDNWDGFEPNF